MELMKAGSIVCSVGHLRGIWLRGHLDFTVRGLTEMDDVDVFEASEPSQPSSKRRKLLYQELETFECQANSVREAARTWALSKNEKVGSFRSPRLIPTMQWETTANCHKHTGCFAACGRVFRFRGTRLDDKYVLEVAFAQDHSGEVRAKPARGRQSATAPPLSVEDRDAVLAAADYLVDQGFKPTPSAVAIRLKADKKDPVPQQALKRTLRWRRQQVGESTSKFLRSQQSFETFAEEYSCPDTEPIAFAYLNVAVFSWVILAVPFFNILQDLHHQGLLEKWSITADFTFNLEWLGFSILAIRSPVVVFFCWCRNK